MDDLNSSRLDDLIFAEKPINKGFIDKTGKVFERLKVIGYAGKNKFNKSTWYCLCSCGKVIQVVGGDLETQNTKSCGCLSRELMAKRSTRHGFKKSPEYNAYMGAKRRCNNPNDAAYKYYGGRGIKFNFNSFEEFIGEVGIKPSEKRLSIDRIDTNGHYEKGNIRWANDLQQANNRRNNRFLTIDGETKTLAEWVKSGNSNDWSRVRDRLDDSGWCPKCAVYTPIGGLPEACCRKEGMPYSKRSQLIEMDGVIKSVAEWSRFAGLQYSVIDSRRRKGWCNRCSILTKSGDKPLVCCDKSQRPSPCARILFINGVSKTSSEWAEKLQIPGRTIRARVDLGWCDQCIVSTPNKKIPQICDNKTCTSNGRTRWVTVEDETLRSSAWARKAGIDPDTLLTRLGRGWCDFHAVTLPSGSKRISDCDNCKKIHSLSSPLPEKIVNLSIGLS
jgi:hypothetical protein